MQKNYLRRSHLSVSAVTLFLASLSFATPAYAGFKWVGSDEVQSAKVTVSPHTEEASGAPVVVTSPETKPALLENKAPVATQDSADGDEKIVRGFADNIPLSVALRQILPSSVGFSVSQDISLGALVSWRGGAPWRLVLKDMLMPAGLTMKEEGSRIHIARAAGSLGTTEKTAVTDSSAPAGAVKPMTLLPSAGPAPSQGVSIVGLEQRPLASASGYLTPPPSGTMIAQSGQSPNDNSVYAGGWTASKGDMLQKTIEAWGRRANVEISWQAEYDYPIQASVALDGTFEEAARALLAGFHDAKPQPIGYLYNNQTAGQTVLVIQTRGNNYSE